MQIIIVALIRNAAGEVLSLKRTKGNVDGVVWSLPSGKVESGESEEDAVIREVLQETGIECRPLEQIGARFLSDDSDLHYWKCAFIGGQPHDPVSKETSEVAFRPIHHFVQLVPPAIMHPCIRAELGIILG
jgi:8-oxo-dGTP diphosphatase